MLCKFIHSINNTFSTSRIEKEILIFSFKISELILLKYRIISIL